MNDDDELPADRPVSHVRSTRAPLKRYAVIWTREIDGKRYVDPIWHVDARDPEHAAELALGTDRPANELRVEEEAATS